MAIVIALNKYSKEYRNDPNTAASMIGIQRMLFSLSEWNGQRNQRSEIVLRCRKSGNHDKRPFDIGQEDSPKQLFEFTIME